MALCPRLFRLAFCAWAAVASVLVLASCDGDRPAAGSETSSDGEWALEVVTRKLRACPAWARLPTLDREGLGRQARAQVVDALEEVRQLPLDVIREAMVQFILKVERLEMEGLEYSETLDKFVLLNKYVFAVPEEAPEGAVRTFGGWDGHVPGPPDAVNYLWPFTQEPDGSLRLTGSPVFWTGSPYGPLDAFDYYRREFGRRTLPWDEGSIEEGIGQSDVRDILARLEACPVWADLPGLDRQGRGTTARAQIVQTLEGIRQYPLRLIWEARWEYERKAERGEVDTAEHQRMLGTFFLLNTYLFAAHGMVQRDYHPYFRFGGWLVPKAAAPPAGVELYPLAEADEPGGYDYEELYPFTKQADGTLRLTGSPLPDEKPYRALDAFYYYRLVFGPREFPRGPR